MKMRCTVNCFLYQTWFVWRQNSVRWISRQKTRARKKKQVASVNLLAWFWSDTVRDLFSQLSTLGARGFSCGDSCFGEVFAVTCSSCFAVLLSSAFRRPDVFRPIRKEKALVPRSQCTNYSVSCNRITVYIPRLLLVKSKHLFYNQALSAFVRLFLQVL